MNKWIMALFCFHIVLIGNVSEKQKWTMSQFNDNHTGTTVPVPAKQDISAIMGTVYFFLTGAMSVLSLFGCILIIATYWIYPDLRTSGRQLLVWLSVADFLTAFGNLLGIIWFGTKSLLPPTMEDVLCQFHSALTIFSSICSFLWIIAMALHLYLCIVKANTRLAKKMHLPFHCICWPIPGRPYYYLQHLLRK